MHQPWSKGAKGSHGSQGAREPGLCSAITAHGGGVRLDKKDGKDAYEECNEGDDMQARVLLLFTR